MPQSGISRARDLSQRAGSIEQDEGKRRALESSVVGSGYQELPPQVAPTPKPSEGTNPLVVRK